MIKDPRVRRSMSRRAVMDDNALAELVLAADPSLPRFFLGRLASLLVRQKRAIDPDQRLALSRAVFSTCLDCVELGLTDQAYGIMAYVDDAAGSDDGVAA